ncbi:MAG: hypothetical protein QOJ65_2015 [Fimbriimonadaceae bacterium]|jgi:uncharacterized NAD(P)/FAD-binding protein YdhS|nr:hypothetical protein [Fimbriimonadaceae bacterium]
MRQNDLSMKSAAPPRLAIVGGGFSGTMTAVHLLKSARGPLDLHMVERKPAWGRGVAYGTRYGSHLLNVPAAKMSAFPSDPDHFFRWLQAHPELLSAPPQPGMFAPRKVYGAYIQSLLAEAEAQAPVEVQVTQWTDEAIDLHVVDDHGRLVLESGATIDVDTVILAIGNFPPGHPHLADRGFFASDRYVGDPWVKGNLDAVKPDDSVLLIGSGLTALDLVLGMRERGHQGEVHMLSRRGQLPQRHQPSEAYPPYLDGELPRTIRELVKRVRAELAWAAQKGVDWRPVLDALRPRTQEIWRALPLREQRRFLDHVRPYWEVHRHRMPPDAAALGEEMLASGRLHLHSARLLSMEEKGDAVAVRFRTRGAEEEKTISVQRVINCTGPECDYRRMRHPLAASLLGQGLVRPDDLALGLDTDSRGALVDAEGNVSGLLYTLGPLRKGTLWETTAVPEIRVQAEQLASELLTRQAVGV